MATATLLAPARSAAQALRESPLPVLRTLGVTETGDEITLSGVVNSYYYKQLAQEAVIPILGGRRLLNRVVVKASS
jgi:hypothetical protein